MTVKKTNEEMYIVEDDNGRIMASILNNGAANQIEVTLTGDLDVVSNTCREPLDDPRIEFITDDNGHQWLRIDTLWDCVLVERQPADADTVSLRMNKEEYLDCVRALQNYTDDDFVEAHPEAFEHACDAVAQLLRSAD